MMRRRDWRQKLEAAMAEMAARPFMPGEVDCALAAADAVEAMTGVDLAAEFRGTYTTLEGGFKRLRKAGFNDLADLVALHFEEVPVAFARVGDIAILDDGRGPALGIVQGERIYVRSPERLATVSLLTAKRVFRV